MADKRIDQFDNIDNSLNNDNLFLLYASGDTYNATLGGIHTFLHINPFTGGTIDGLTANTISATTYQGLPTDVFVTGGTYTNGEITFKNNIDNIFTVNNLPIGGAGGQIYYFNLSNNQTPYKEFSVFGLNNSEQFATVSVDSGVSSTIQSFLTPIGYPNTLLIPSAYWSFYLHSYKEDSNANFELYCDIYIRTSGGSETYLFSTDPTDNILESPNVTMVLTDGYFSGCSINTSDRILIKVNATNIGVSTKTITLFSEGSQHYSYGVTPFSNNNSLTCESLSGCNTIQIIQSDLTTVKSGLTTKLNKSGDTMTGTLFLPSISATTYQGLPTDIRVTGATYSNNTFTYTNNTGGTFSSLFNTVTGLTVNGVLTVTGNTSVKGLTATTISATTYQNLPTDIRVTGATYSNNTFTYTNNTGGTFSSLFNTVTGLTVNGNLTVSGTSQIIFSSNTSSDLVRLTQTGTGNPFVVEDSTNPDATPFVINNIGNVGIGVPSPSDKLVVSGKTVTNTIQIISGGTSNYVLTSDASGNGRWAAPILTNYTDSSTVSATVGDTSYTVFPNISVTPSAGTYLVNFTSDIQTSNNSGDWIEVALFYGAVEQTETRIRTISVSSGGDGGNSQRGSVATHWILTANGSTAVAPYYRTSSATNNWTLYNRVLTLVRIG